MLVAAADLHRFIEDVFCAQTVTREHAKLIADVLVWANLRGADSHGVQRLPTYLERLENGEMNPRPEMTISPRTASCFVLEADRSSGMVSMILAMRRAISDARKTGISFGLVRETTHVGPVGYYTELAAEAGMAAIAISAALPNMAYFGTGSAGVATNPLSIAVPGGAGGPILLDMATAVAALGKIMHARHTGAALEPGWALDGAGQPTVDPQAAVLPLPLGGAKGAGLSLMFECLTSLLADNPLVSEALRIDRPAKRHQQNAAVIAIDIAAFTDLQRYRDEIDRLAISLKRLPKSGTDEILMPGERGAGMRDARMKDGIPLPAKLWEELLSIASARAIAMPAARDSR